jgi:hypothetical protein
MICAIHKALDGAELLQVKTKTGACHGKWACVHLEEVNEAQRLFDERQRHADQRPGDADALESGETNHDEASADFPQRG